MKKYVLLGISLVLVVACVFCGIEKRETIIAGPGTGLDYALKDSNELSDVLLFLFAGNERENSLKSMNVVNLLSTDEGESQISVPSDEPENWSDKYSSATVTILTRQSSSSSSSHPKHTNHIMSSDHSINRELTIYITEDAIFYQSKGIFRESTTRENENREVETDNIRFNFDMQIMSMGGESVYANFKSFSYEDNEESRQIKYKSIGKWIKIPQTMVDEFIDIEVWNGDILQSFGELLDYLVESGEIEADDTYVALDEYDLVQLSDDFLFTEYLIPSNDPEEMNVTFSYDLTSPNVPYISYLMSYNDETSLPVQNTNGSIDQVTVTNNIASSSQFIIKNINNTVVSFDVDNVEYTANTQEEFDKLFTIERRG